MTDLPTLDPIALDDIREIDDDGTLLPEIIELFRSETPARVQAVRDAFENRQADALMQEAHALKSSAAQLGGRQMSELCRRIEMHGREGRVVEAGALVADLERAARAVDAALASALESGR
jgi:HPt (histidine-containing phosphotransfer) domain-containing protein